MKQKAPRIAATLRYGRTAHLFTKIIANTTLYFSVAMCCIFFLIFMLSHFGAMEEDERGLLILTAAMFGAACFALIPVILLTVEERKIRLWLKDAVPLTAQSQIVGVQKRGLCEFEAVKISVKFVYNGKEHIQTSGNPKRRNASNGFTFIYNDYTDREIKILYSPSYDQVMVLWEDKITVRRSK